MARTSKHIFKLRKKDMSDNHFTCDIVTVKGMKLIIESFTHCGYETFEREWTSDWKDYWLGNGMIEIKTSEEEYLK
jgi:hypothetical protein